MNTETLNPIPVPDCNWDRSIYPADACELCGKQMKRETIGRYGFVASPQDWFLYDPALMADADQVAELELGVYYCGPECIKKIPRGYRV